MEIRSKYQAKNYEEVEYHLEEVECRKCGKPFMADFDCFPFKYFDDQARPFYEITCPYCKHTHYRCS